MSDVAATRPVTQSARSPSRYGIQSPFAARASLLLVIALAAVGGMMVTDAAATARAIAGAGQDWANLLRGMAALKLLFAAAAAAAVLWRLGAPISAASWCAHALAAAITWAGPGLIWGLAHIVAGTLLLHGGLIATVGLVWCDPATRSRLSEVIAHRRAGLRARS